MTLLLVTICIRVGYKSTTTASQLLLTSYIGMVTWATDAGPASSMQANPTRFDKRLGRKKLLFYGLGDTL